MGMDGCRGILEMSKMEQMGIADGKVLSSCAKNSISEDD